MKKYLMTSTVTFEVEDDVTKIFNAIAGGRAGVVDSRMTMVNLETGEVVISDLDLMDSLSGKLGGLEG